MNCDFAELAMGGIFIAVGIGILIELSVLIFRHSDNNDDE